MEGTECLALKRINFGSVADMKEGRAASSSETTGGDDMAPALQMRAV